MTEKLLYTQILELLNHHHHSNSLIISKTGASDTRLRINLGHARYNGHITGPRPTSPLNEDDIYRITDSGKSKLKELLEPPAGQMELVL